MCRISGTCHDFSTVNITVEKFCQHRKKNKSSPWLLKNYASDCWRIVPSTVEWSCQWLLNNRSSDFWTIVPGTEESCTDCRTFVPVTIEEFSQWLLKNRASDYWTILPASVAHNSEQLNNRASDCWRVGPVTVEELYEWLLKNCASGCWWIVTTTVEQSCQLIFSLFLPYFDKILTSFSCKYFNYYWLFQFRITTK